MKLGKIIFVFIFMLAVLTAGSVAASDNLNATDLSADDVGGDAVQAFEDEKLSDSVEISVFEEEEIVKGDDNPVATINFPDDAKGKLYVYLNGTAAGVDIGDEEEDLDDKIFVSKTGSSQYVSIDAENEWDSYEIIFGDLPVGFYNVLIKYVGNKGKYSTEESFTLNVIPSGDDDDDGESVDISVPYQTILIGDKEPEYVAINFPEDVGVKGKLSIYVNGTKARLKIEDIDDEEIVVVYLTGTARSLSIDADEDESSYEISFYKLPKGVYNINITYIDNGKYSAYKAFNLTVTTDAPPEEEEEEELEINLESVYMYRNAKLIIKGPEAIINGFNVTIDGIPYQILNESNVRYVNLSGLGLGPHDIEIFNSSDVVLEDSFEIGGIINVPSEDSITYGDNHTISLILPEKAKGHLMVEVDGDLKFEKPLVNGTAAVSLNSFGVGTFSFTAYYDGDDYDVADQSFNLDIYPNVTMPSVMNAGENKYMILKFNDDAKGTVSVIIGHEEYYSADVVNGTVRVPLAGLEDELNDIHVMYEGSDSSVLEWDYELEVKSVKPKLIAKNVKMNYLDGTRFKVSVYGTNSRPAKEGDWVEIKIGKKTYEYVYTDKKGVAKLKITLPPGKYRVRVNYDDMVRITKTLVIKKNLKLSKVVVKKSAKKLVLKATLKNGKKPLKGKKITFKFNGKKFRAKTNKKGVAKVTIKQKMLKKLKVGKKVKYQATYVKETVKRSAKVKK